MNSEMHSEEPVLDVMYPDEYMAEVDQSDYLSRLDHLIRLNREKLVHDGDRLAKALKDGSSSEEIEDLEMRVAGWRRWIRLWERQKARYLDFLERSENARARAGESPLF